MESNKKKQGFTLVELMIASVFSLVIVLLLNGMFSKIIDVSEYSIGSDTNFLKNRVHFMMMNIKKDSEEAQGLYIYEGLLSKNGETFRELTYTKNFTTPMNEVDKSTFLSDYIGATVGSGTSTDTARRAYTMVFVNGEQSILSIVYCITDFDSSATTLTHTFERYAISGYVDKIEFTTLNKSLNNPDFLPEFLEFSNYVSINVPNPVSSTLASHIRPNSNQYEIKIPQV